RERRRDRPCAAWATRPDGATVPNPDGCVERDEGGSTVTAISLSCRVCATEHPLEAIGTCRTRFGPLAPVYDWDFLRATVTRERLASGPPSLWRYADLLPVEAPYHARPPPGAGPLAAGAH